MTVARDNGRDNSRRLKTIRAVGQLVVTITGLIAAITTLVSHLH